MDLNTFHQSAGATLAPDGIPLHYGNQTSEYQSALQAVVLMDRSHEGRIAVTGRDRFEVIHRISTNDIAHMVQGEGRPTILTTPTGRIIDRLVVYQQGESALVTTEPGRGQAVRDYLQRNIFFNDDMRLQDLSPVTKQFSLHGPLAEPLLRQIVPTAGISDALQCIEVSLADIPITVLQRKPLVGSHWAILVPTEKAVDLWQALLQLGNSYHLTPAGSLTYNAIRILSGRPGVGRELSDAYIPLEAGLWDEISFKKGCYTGQEIIARMESRNRLAKVMVKLDLTGMVDAPASLVKNGKEIGTLTSSVVTPDGQIVGIGFVKTAFAQQDEIFDVDQVLYTARITGLAGTPAPMLTE